MAIAGHNTKQIGLVIISTFFTSIACKEKHYFLIMYFGQGSGMQKEWKGGKMNEQKKIVIDVNKKGTKRDAEIGRKVNASVNWVLAGRSGNRIPAGVTHFSCLEIVHTGSGAPPRFLFSR
jgi:hypothetical protein